MKRVWLVLSLSFCLPVAVTRADTVILGAGASYAGHFQSSGNQIGFTDAQGVQCKFPIQDVQSIVFASTADIVALRNGKMYSGQYEGPESVGFSDAQGIQYQFPLRDVETIVFTQGTAPTVSGTVVAKVIPLGSAIVVQSARRPHQGPCRNHYALPARPHAGPQAEVVSACSAFASRIENGGLTPLRGADSIEVRVNWNENGLFRLL